MRVVSLPRPKLRKSGLLEGFAVGFEMVSEADTEPGGMAKARLARPRRTAPRRMAKRAMVLICYRSTMAEETVEVKLNRGGVKLYATNQGGCLGDRKSVV